MDRLMKDAALRRELARVETHVTPGYADYLNPLASFVAAAVHYAKGEKAQGNKALEEVRGMVPGQPAALRLLDGAVEPANGTVYLIYEKGMAPARREFRLTLPSPKGAVFLAVPILQFQPDPASHLSVRDSDGATLADSHPLASIDSIIATQYRHALPGILIRTAIATAAKEGIHYTADRLTRDQDGWLRVLVSALTHLFKAATSGADLRTWRTLGSEIQVAVFPLPADRTFTVHLMDRGGRTFHLEQVFLPDAPVHVVTVRSVGRNLLHLEAPGRIPPAGSSLETGVSG